VSKSSAHRVTVILDDDPTGTQTVHGIPVLTVWGYDEIVDQLARDTNAFFILTNSRALPPDQAYALILEICSNLKRASSATGRQIGIMLRSDSTLRGHFPLEAYAAEKVFGVFDKWILCPFFEEGGRITMNDIHYIRSGGTDTPVGRTEFALDHSFGYKSSDLREWIEEKSAGKIKKESVGSLSVGADNNPEPIISQLLSAGKFWVANTASMKEMKTLTKAFKAVEDSGTTILYRTAASLVQAYLGIDKKDLLSSSQLRNATSEAKTHGGVVVIGSYVDKTTVQLKHLLELPELNFIELNIESKTFDEPALLAGMAKRMNDSLASGITTVLYTSRKKILAETFQENFILANRISQALVEIIKRVDVTPDFFIAKGGITSSDIASKGLGVKKAEIIGQARPGIPVWLTGKECRFPGLPYIVFPGNVGEAETLKELVLQILDDKAAEK